MLQILPLDKCKRTASQPGGIYLTFHLGKSHLTHWRVELGEPDCVSACCRVEQNDSSYKTKTSRHCRSKERLTEGVEMSTLTSPFILVSNQFDAQFLLRYVYLNHLHVSSNPVFILRRTIVLIHLLVQSFYDGSSPVCRSRFHLDLHTGRSLTR
jgi:hypothetical protein